MWLALLKKSPLSFNPGDARLSSVRTIGDAALHASGAVRASPHAALLHVELVVVLAAQHGGSAETTPDFEALCKWGLLTPGKTKHEWATHR